VTEPFSLYDLVRPMRLDTNNAQNQAVSNASGVAQHQTTLTGKTNSGNYVTDGFNRTGATIGSGWTATNTGVGSVATNGVDAYWSPSGTAAATEFDRYTSTITQTDYQLITVVLDEPLVSSGALHRIIARCDTGQANYVYLQWDGSNISIWKVVASTATQVGSNVAYTPNVGDSVQFTVGTATNVREFIATVNNSNPLIDVTDTAATLSVVGSNNRYTGLYWGVGAGPTLPGNIHSFNVADNSTPGTTGSGAFIYRTSTTQVAASSGSFLLPTSFFGNTKFSTSDITVDLTNNKFTVARPGLYMCVMRVQINSVSAATLTPLLYKNGSIDTWGAPWWGTSADGTGPNAAWSLFPVQLAANDYVQPGYNSTSSLSNQFYGEATGVKTYFSISAASRSGF
jgi:hypothetical protein